ETYETFLDEHGVAPECAVMFEDLAQNLVAPHAMGMTTVLVCSDAAWLADEPHDKRPAKPGETAAHVHHTTNDLTAFLQRVQTSMETSNHQDGKAAV
ncbi:MAG: hypothetical protein ACX939_05020, partial [Hyphococcus sp.]